MPDKALSKKTVSEPAVTVSEPIVLGRIIGAHGVRGWVKVHCYADDPQLWRQNDVYCQADGAPQGTPWQPIKLLAHKLQAAGMVIQLDGVQDRTAADALKGTLLAIPRASLPATGDKEYYWADLLGLRVINQADELLGTVHKLLETGAHCVLQVHAEADAVDGGNSAAPTERLLPFVDSVILAVDLSAGQIRVDWGKDW